MRQVAREEHGAEAGGQPQHQQACDQAARAPPVARALGDDACAAQVGIMIGGAVSVGIGFGQDG
jgi:hypothetical protein